MYSALRGQSEPDNTVDDAVSTNEGREVQIEIERVYEPDNSIRQGYVALLRDIAQEIAANRWLTFQLFKRDIAATYKQSFIGYFWVLVLPAFSVVTFTVLGRSGVLQIGELSKPYPLFAIVGVMFWQLFATGLVAGTNSLVEAGSMLRIISFSKKSLVISSTSRALVPFAIQIIPAAMVFIGYRVLPHFSVLLLPLFVLPLFLLTLALSFIFSLLNSVFRDIGNVLTIVITFLMFLTPVLYVPPQEGVLARLTQVNPVYHLLAFPRGMILDGLVIDPEGFAWTAIFSVALFVACLIAFHLTETRITERV